VCLTCPFGTAASSDRTSCQITASSCQAGNYVTSDSQCRPCASGWSSAAVRVPRASPLTPLVQAPLPLGLASNSVAAIARAGRVKARPKPQPLPRIGCAKLARQASIQLLPTSLAARRARVRHLAAPFLLSLAVDVPTCMHAAGKFQPSPGQTSCINHAPPCSAGSRQTQAPTTQQDRLCATCDVRAETGCGTQAADVAACSLDLTSTSPVLG